MLLVLYCIFIGFLGYAIGRMGHIYGGHINGPDHWTFGVGMFLPGLFFSNFYIFLMFSFGLGLIISDLIDFLNLKLWVPDEVKMKKFWHID